MRLLSPSNAFCCSAQQRLFVVSFSSPPLPPPIFFFALALFSRGRRRSSLLARSKRLLRRLPKRRLDLFAFVKVQQLVKSLVNVVLGVQISALLRHSLEFEHSRPPQFPLHSEKLFHLANRRCRMMTDLFWLEDSWLTLIPSIDLKSLA